MDNDSLNSSRFISLLPSCSSAPARMARLGLVRRRRCTPSSVILSLVFQVKDRKEMILILMIIHYPCNPLIPEDSEDLTQRSASPSSFSLFLLSHLFARPWVMAEETRRREREFHLSRESYTQNLLKWWRKSRDLCCMMIFLFFLYMQHSSVQLSLSI